jgi:hypothetical protein
LEEEAYPYLILDARYERVREGGIITRPALPERRVTLHTGDMGDTSSPLRGEQRCRGRSVRSWTSV